MKVAIVEAGAVGSATALSLVERGGTCREIVLIDRDTARADGVAAGLRYAAPLSPTVDVRSGGYDDPADAAIVVITAGVNEKNGRRRFTDGFALQVAGEVSRGRLIRSGTDQAAERSSDERRRSAVCWTAGGA
ncbi:hypothetical protein ACIRQP_24695 [Streptomyces sp. NPDC102274]|uniref:lactate/malate family dehydrogenase n=1 Tax=Streptomyces sp. NPDC102274 TaxID=3366151 RepID=UPI0038291FA9